jgi:hypothetical protein
LRPEDWNANFQTTYIWQMHPGFAACNPDGPHSLKSQHETGYTLTATLFLGYRPWRGAELFFNPEVLQSTTMSDLHGLGGLSNGENQKAADPTARSTARGPSFARPSGWAETRRRSRRARISSAGRCLPVAWS